LHGASLGSSGDVFARNMGPLAAGGLRAIAPDRPGYGLSDGPGDASLQGHRLFILGLLDALGLDSAVLVGHSQQSNPAAVLTLEQPERVPQAVILGGGGLLPPLPRGDHAAGAGGKLTGEATLGRAGAHMEGGPRRHAL